MASILILICRIEDLTFQLVDSILYKGFLLAYEEVTSRFLGDVEAKALSKIALRLAKIIVVDFFHPPQDGAVGKAAAVDERTLPAAARALRPGRSADGCPPLLGNLDREAGVVQYQPGDFKGCSAHSRVYLEIFK